MFIDDELEAAGRRAAHCRVADPLPVADLKREVQRRRNNARSLGGAFVAALLFMGGAGAMVAASADEVQVISATPVQSDSSVDVAAASESSTEDKFSSGEARSSGSYRFDADSGDVSAKWGDWWTDVEYESGDDADAEALKAAAEADETLVVDGDEVWIDRYEDSDGDAAVSVSSLSDGKFIRLSGPASAEEQLIDIVTWGHSGDSYALKDDDGDSSASNDDDGDSSASNDDDGDSSAQNDEDGDMSADEDENSDSHAHEHGEEWAEYGEKWVEYGEEWAEYGEKWADWAKELADEWKEEGSDHHSDTWGNWFHDSESHSSD